MRTTVIRDITGGAIEPGQDSMFADFQLTM